jgi:hypothetical protein
LMGLNQARSKSYYPDLEPSSSSPLLIRTIKLLLLS